MGKLSYSRLLKSHATRVEYLGENFSQELERLQFRMLRAQQGVFASKARAVVVFEGLDAAGKGGAIRRLTEKLDPRGIRVHTIGAPTPQEQGRHWLYRFWVNLPKPGTIAVFDRSWYGRALVEKVEMGLPKADVKRAYREINEFERTLVEDGIVLHKFFLGVSKKEQLVRFEDRLRDPTKQWKIGSADIKSRQHWDEYVVAIDTVLKKTHHRHAPWTLIPADDKEHARKEVLSTFVNRLKKFERYAEREIRSRHDLTLDQALRALGLRRTDL